LFAGGVFEVLFEGDGHGLTEGDEAVDVEGGGGARAPCEGSVRAGGFEVEELGGGGRGLHHGVVGDGAGEFDFDVAACALVGEADVWGGGGWGGLLGEGGGGSGGEEESGEETSAEE
jgi:hypothetical protein